MTKTRSKTLSRGSVWQEVASLERVIFGMMGGLVAVTANATYIEPWMALLEAVVGASVAIIGSAVIDRFWEYLDDPVGAISVHGLARIPPLLFTPLSFLLPHPTPTP